MLKSKSALKLAAAVVAVLLSIAVYRLAVQSSPFLTTTSPNGTYVVQLSGRKDRTTLPVIYHRVRFSVSKNGRSFLTNRYLYSGDWLDPTFGILYPRQIWASDSALHFQRPGGSGASAPGRLVVVNRASKEIKYLRVESIDLFLLFSMQPGSTIYLNAAPPRGDFIWVSVAGEFSDGRAVKETAASFLVPNEARGPFTYHIFITDDGSIIESAQLKQY